MLDQTLIPTSLIDAADRPKIIIVRPRKPSAYWVLRFFGTLIRWGASMLGTRLRGKLTKEAYARHFRELLEELGGLWIKVGQLLALRVDMFSIEFCRELSNLHDQASGFPSDMSRKIVEEDLGGPLDRFFDYFDEAPVAAASIGQVHRAHLRQENVWVAVKVQRPYVESTFRHDLQMIESIAWVLKMLSILPFMNWDEGILELRQILHEEIDYRFEASATRRVRKTLRKHDIYVPKVFSNYLTRRVLVTEFIPAVLMADFIKVYASDPVKLAAWLQENNIDPHLVARRLILSIFRQLFEDNLYHGDLHPGNILLLRDSHAAFIDLGTIGFSDREFLQKMRWFTAAMATGEYAKVADISFLMCGTLPVVDLDAMKSEFIRMMKAWEARTLVKQLPYHDKSMDNALVGVAKIMFQHKITAEWAFLRIRRALTTLDSALIYLFPQANYMKLIEDYFCKAARREIERAQKEIVPRLVKVALTGLDLHQSAHEYMFYQSEIVRRQARVFEGTTGKFSYLLAVLWGQVAMVQFVLGMVFVAVFLHQHYPGWIDPLMSAQLSQAMDIFPRLSPQVWVLILLVDFYLCWTSLSLRNRFARRELRLESQSS